MDMIDYCMKELSDIFTPIDIVLALEKLVNMRPLPIFFMRTTIQLFKLAQGDKAKVVNHILKWIKEIVKNQKWEKSQWDGFLILLDCLGEKAIPSLLNIPLIKVKKLLP